MTRLFFFFGTILILLNSCVTPKVFNDLSEKHQQSQSLLFNEEMKTLDLKSQLEELKAEMNSLNTKISILRNDSVQNGRALVSLTNKYDELSDSYDVLASKNSRYMAEKANETKKLLEQLDQAQATLYLKEDELNKLSFTLSEKEEALKLSQQELDARSLRVIELEAIINKKDSIVSALKQSISKALIGLEGEGLTVVQKNGKVYISLEEDLLFASGKYEVNDSGLNALNKLSKVLASQNELEILVEGHTDSIPLSGRGLVRDNWDLSVMRATNVVKVLLENKALNPKQLTAAGRSEFVPISSNQSKEGRRDNRRIEMILSPNLDDLYNLLDN